MVPSADTTRSLLDPQVIGAPPGTLAGVTEHGTEGLRATILPQIERTPPVATQPKKQWPVWMIVVAIVILIPPIVWALSITINIVAAMSVGGVLLVAGIIWLFIAIKGRVDAER